VSSLRDAVVFVTGAARGIGAGTARALAQRGARLILVDLDEAPLQEIAAELGEDRALAVACDVCDLEAMQRSLRLDVAHRGVQVGSAHMSWIDTPLVQDAKADLPSFREMLSHLPGPLGKTLPLQRCVDAFVDGLEQRKRRVYVPRWVALLAWLKPLVTSPLGERESLKRVPEMLPLLDAEVERLGRSTSARNVALEDTAVTPK
jgi:NAD(P)-dependent dehydrogenase (short-subunit alcohol dehydrogenase family)